MRYPASYITGVLLPDGWHSIAGSLSLDWEPQIYDGQTGQDATPDGGPWLRWTEPGGTVTSAPLRNVLAIQHKPSGPPPGTVKGGASVALTVTTAAD